MLLQSVKDAGKRFVNLAINTDEEWNVIASEHPPLADALFPFTALGLLVCLLAFVAGYFLRTFRGFFAMELLLTLAVYPLAAALFTLAASFLAGRMGAVRKELSPVVCLYSFSPAWVLSALNVIPVVSFGWLWLVISLIFITIVFGKAAANVIGIPPAKVVPFVALGVAAAALPMLAFFLVKFLWLLGIDAA